MTHDEAVKNMSVERFLLGELQGPDLEEFESHIFDCQTCFLKVKIGQKFTSNIGGD